MIQIIILFNLLLDLYTHCLLYTSQNTLWLPATRVLCKVNLMTLIGRVYKLSENEIYQTIEAFKDYSKVLQL